jgi:hypothetical protein
MVKNKNQLQKIYLHVISPSIPIEGFDFFDIKQFKKVKKKSVEEIYIGDLLDYIDQDNCAALLADIISKISKNGKLFIQGIDAKALASAFVYNHINIDIYKNILYNNKVNIHTLGSLRNFISGFGELEISKCKYINNMQYYIEYVVL